MPWSIKFTEAQPMGVGHQFKPYERIVPLKVSLRLRQSV